MIEAVPIVRNFLTFENLKGDENYKRLHIKNSNKIFIQSIKNNPILPSYLFQTLNFSLHSQVSTVVPPI
jgi:hypothetical protein